MKNNKKICVIGGGRWGKNHLKTLHRLNSLSAIVDNNQSLLRDLKKIYPDVLFFSSIEETFSHKFSGYVIATPAPTHFEIAKTVIERGFPVLIEKPMTLNVADAESLIRIADKNQVNIMVGHVLLFHPAIQKIKELVDTGTIGELQYIYSNRLNLGQVRKEEDVLVDSFSVCLCRRCFASDCDKRCGAENTPQSRGDVGRYKGTYF